MKQTIQLTKNELNKVIKEAVKTILNENISEFDDWRAQMLYNGALKDTEGKPTFWSNHDGARKANKLAKTKYGADIADDDERFPDTSGDFNAIQLTPNYGRISSTERDETGDTVSDFEIRSPKAYSDGDKGELKYQSNKKKTNSFDYKRNIKTDKAKDFQQRAGDDMVDFYSGAYKDRLKAKASMLGNANSGQDFTPDALNEAVKRAVRKYLG